MDETRRITIGGASGAWGDSPRALEQMLQARPDFLIMDYMAEVTMSLLARARQKDPEAGYVGDFVRFLTPHLAGLKTAGLRIATNAGGMNPRGAAEALRQAAEAAGVTLSIHYVEGDDVRDILLDPGKADTYLGTPPAFAADRLLTANAYTGAAPIRAAFDAGADIVITGRCADSALALGILQHGFGWDQNDHDRAAAGSLVGHVLECGPQATGGTHADWHLVPGWENIGYPIASCAKDGSFELYKPEGTGGLVTPAVVSEQILYEVGDPANYLLPDVCADFTNVTVTPVSDDRVRVSGARGSAPNDALKVSATWQDGFRIVFMVSIVGPLAVRKAEKTAAAIIARGRAQLAAAGLPDFDATHVEVLGAEASYMDRAAARPREVILRLVIQHQNANALKTLALEAGSIGLSCAPGTTGVIGGRPRPTPVIRLHSCMIAKADMPAQVLTGPDGVSREIPVARSQDHRPNGAADWPEDDTPDGDRITVPLMSLAYSRSGDKGNSSNIAIFARDPRFYGLIAREVTVERLLSHFGQRIEGPGQVFAAPGLRAVNVLLQNALGGGGIASQRIDPQGKSYGQVALEMPVEVPRAWLVDGLLSATPFEDVERTFDDA